jgi:predicted RNase H-like HicB family nuclease
MILTPATDRETDSRWIGEAPELQRVLIDGATEYEAMALTLCVMAEQIEHHEPTCSVKS